jgi:hypothetical protein
LASTSAAAAPTGSDCDSPLLMRNSRWSSRNAGDVRKIVRLDQGARHT